MSSDPISQKVITSISHSLQLGDKSSQTSLDTPLLGHLPELDSMAVLAVIAGLDEYFAITFDDDDISSKSFRTVGNLVGLVSSRIE